MAGIFLEKSGAVNYPVSLHLGCYTVPVDKGVIEELKKHLDSPVEVFLELTIQKITSNTYLHDLIHREMKSAGDIPKQISSLQDFVRTYQNK